MTQIFDSHKGWKRKIIKLKSLRDFGVSLEWRLADDSQNSLLEATEAEVAAFAKI